MRVRAADGLRSCWYAICDVRSPADALEVTYRRSAGAEQSGELFAAAVMLWSAGEQLAGLQQLLSAGSRATGCRERGQYQVRARRCCGIQTIYTSQFRMVVTMFNGHAWRRLQGYTPGLDAELALDLLQRCSARPQLRLWQSASRMR